MPTLGYFDPKEPVANLAGNLPHWRQEGVTYFVTFRLGDSIPLPTLRRWERERDYWVGKNPEPRSPEKDRYYHQQFTERFQRWLDKGWGQCWLAQEGPRAKVVEALLAFHGERYELDEWVVMPNHVHCLVTPLARHELSEIEHSWKSYTSNQINLLLGRAGGFWQKESFDHILRSPDEALARRTYIRENPEGLREGTYARGCGREVACR